MTRFHFHDIIYRNEATAFWAASSKSRAAMTAKPEFFKISTPFSTLVPTGTWHGIGMGMDMGHGHGTWASTIDILESY